LLPDLQGVASLREALPIWSTILAGMVEKITVGWEPTCDCPPQPPVPCLVLDPFGGSGTTVMVADQLGRDGIMVDLKLEYAKMAADRVVGPGS
jgi:DNA methylase